jgi:glyoxylase-like metal-dependent hydrolase (beta-lactamase superfamily II)
MTDSTLDFRIIPVTAFQQNTTLLWCTRTRATVIIDPGGEPDRIVSAVATLRLAPHAILLTHGHLDHVGASAELSQRLGIPIWGPHADDAFWIDALPQQCEMFGFDPVSPFTPARWLESGDAIQVGEAKLEVYHCPGHTPGHVVFVSAADRLAQVGDVLFKGSIGRTDFPRGNHAQLLRSIHDTLLPLGDAIRFIPGHGPMSTFGEERRSNPFIRHA